ncbi:hypothetical protein ACO2Q9_00740 [Variovorax sp. VNK109]|uniref:hypothetical protein n=1 Tax=Variovorax sp. VNK109 TaxID=3400919 RepID=UPI003C0A8D26
MPPTPLMALRIHILGAGHTGKTTLHSELTQALKARGADVVVSEISSLPDSPSPSHEGDALHLLMGLDLGNAQAGEKADVDLRSQLASAGIAYRVIYGRGPARLTNALRAVEERLNPDRQDPSSTVPWVWTCEKCSDPACEHRLFSRLTNRADEP